MKRGLGRKTWDLGGSYDMKESSSVCTRTEKKKNALNRKRSGREAHRKKKEARRRKAPAQVKDREIELPASLRPSSTIQNTVSKRPCGRAERNDAKKEKKGQGEKPQPKGKGMTSGNGGGWEATCSKKKRGFPVGGGSRKLIRRVWVARFSGPYPTFKEVPRVRNCKKAKSASL